MIALRKTSLGALGHVTGILRAKNQQKLTNLNQYILVSVDIEKKMVCDFGAQCQPPFV